MKKLISTFATGIAVLLLAAGCSAMSEKAADSGGSGTHKDPGGGDSDGGSSSDGGENGNGQQNQPGVLTAGEWSDLNGWDFWQELLKKDNFCEMPGYWGFYTEDRIAVDVKTGSGEAAANVAVAIIRDGDILARGRTNNKGRVELWPNLFQTSNAIDYNALTLEVNGTPADVGVIPFRQGVCEVILTDYTPAERSIELAFMVDATGSMSDEMSYLKTELVDVVRRVQSENSGASILTGALFYRDYNDDYVTRISHFTSDIATTNDFINAQVASGGGDFPEAVHTALDQTLHQLQWSENARTKILFVLLDAPPHYESQIITSLHESVTAAMEKGIRVIPIVASGIDKETEFLMRFMAISTGGTYVFITDDSGVGNTHLEPSVGYYVIEPLNDLLVRLINAYSE